MKTLTPGERRALRAKAHHLRPVVSVGQHGLTLAVLHEVDVNLTAHELIKIRVLGDDRDARDAMLADICEAVDAAPVQHLGKILTVWRPTPEPPAPPPKSAASKRPARRPSARTSTPAPAAPSAKGGAWNRDSKRPTRRPPAKAAAPRPRRRRPAS